MLETLWVDHYRPKSLNQLSYHPQITQILKELASTENFPHIILYGPPGSGKKTRAVSFVKECFHTSALIMSEDERILKPQGTSKTIEYTMLYSPFHIEITPSDYEFDDRYIVQNVVKEIAAEKGSSKNDKLFKILIINEADKLSREAQGALRRTMEKYMSRCRMILVCDTVHQLIMPIRSRCLNIRVPAPSNFELAGILTQVAHEQKLGINEGTIDRIIESSRGNVRDAICQLECYRYSKKPETIFHPYKPQILQIIKMILSEQSPNQILSIRAKIYDMLVNCVEGNIILKELVIGLVETEKIREDAMKNLINQGTHLERTMAQGGKTIVHLECFIAHAMEAVIRTKQSN